MSIKLFVYTDGASRGNPGKSASGYMIFDEKGKKLKEEVFYNDVKTNNFAEYNAILQALIAIKKYYGEKVDVKLFSDSELVISQIRGIYKTKDHDLQNMKTKVLNLASFFEACSFTNVPRDEKHIKMVDKALNIFLDNVKK